MKLNEQLHRIKTLMSLNEQEEKLLAPNGRPSKLPPLQYKLVRTPEFKNWFGDWENDPENSSKVVDENGEPLVVYHGTGESFEEFRKDKLKRVGWGYGFHFAQSPGMASFYANQNPSGNVISAFLSIKNPIDGNEINKYSYKNNAGMKESTEYFMELGYDGAEYMDEYWRDNKKTKVFAAFNPNQIKSSMANIGKFDPNNPDIKSE